MPSLYRCRTSLSEVAALFGATPPARADWSAEVRPARTGLIVRQSEEGRRIEAMRWGAELPEALPISRADAALRCGSANCGPRIRTCSRPKRAV